MNKHLSLLTVIVLLTIMMLTIPTKNMKEFFPLIISITMAFVIPSDISDMILRGVLFNYYVTSRLYS